MRKLTTQEMHKIAKSHGGVCLSDSYINEKSKLKWQCSKGHIWDAAPGNIKSGNWCPHCARNIRLTIDEMQKIAKSKGGKCLSTEYKNLFSKLKWQCSKGHIWETSPCNVKNANHWCPYCAGNARLTISVAKNIAKERGGKCLSTEYKNTFTKMRWQCSKGHIWEARLADIKNDNNWCPYCSHHVRLTIEEMHQIASSRGGKCLSTKYIDTDSKLLWQCEKGHKWKATPNNVKKGTWCPTCFGSPKLSIKDMKQLSKSKGGKCLSKLYVNGRTKLIWKCKENHIWESRAHDVRHGQWCPICSQGISERICCKYFENIFNTKFSKTRLKWLVNSKGNKLELDGYNKELGLAFEYHGVQHFKHINLWHKKRTLEQQRQDDETKRSLCQLHNIILIEIPYTVKHEEIGNFIIHVCETKGIRIPNKEDMNYKDFDIYSKQYLKEAKEIAVSKGGLCLSTNYITQKTKLKWQCKEGHVWFAVPQHVKEGHWCPFCSRINRRK